MGLGCIFVLTVASERGAGAMGTSSKAKRWTPDELKKLLFTQSSIAVFINSLGYKLVLFPFAFFRMQKHSYYYVSAGVSGLQQDRLHNGTIFGASLRCSQFLFNALQWILLIA